MKAKYLNTQAYEDTLIKPPQTQQQFKSLNSLTQANPKKY